MKRSMKLAAATVGAAATIGLASPAANAATIDQALYPQTGHIYIDPVTTKVLAATPSAEAAGAAKRFLRDNTGPSTTLAVIGSAQIRINRDVRTAAQYPQGSVHVWWKILDDGSVVTTTTVNKR